MLLGLVGAVFGVQALLGRAFPKARIVVMLSDAPSETQVCRQFFRGFAVGEESVRRCRAEMPSVHWTDLSDDQAPPAADLRAFD